MEKVEVLGVGSNLQTSKPVVSFDKTHSNNPELRSQASVDFGNASRSKSGNEASFGDEVVIQVQSRLLDHSNVTDGAQFWLYFGMDYQNESVWVIGKSIKADVQRRSAKLGTKMYLPSGSFVHAE